MTEATKVHLSCSDEGSDEDSFTVVTGCAEVDETKEGEVGKVRRAHDELGLDDCKQDAKESGFGKVKSFLESVKLSEYEKTFAANGSVCSACPHAHLRLYA